MRSLRIHRTLLTRLEREKVGVETLTEPRTEQNPRRELWIQKEGKKKEVDRESTVLPKASV